MRLAFGAAEIMLRVADDGVGFDLSGYEKRSVSDRRFGLTIMRERARARAVVSNPQHAWHRHRITGLDSNTSDGATTA